MSAYAKGDAVRLLRAIDVEQTHGRVGASVFAFAAARSATEASKSARGRICS